MHVIANLCLALALFDFDFLQRAVGQSPHSAEPLQLHADRNLKDDRLHHSQTPALEGVMAGSSGGSCLPAALQPLETPGVSVRLCHYSSD